MAQRASARSLKHTHTHVPINPGRSPHACPPACLPNRGEAWVEAYRDNQCALSCLSCSFMLPLSACVCVCACFFSCVHVLLSDQGKFMLLLDGYSVKGCFGLQTPDPKCASSCLPFLFISGCPWRGAPFRVLPLHI